MGLGAYDAWKTNYDNSAEARAANDTEARQVADERQLDLLLGDEVAAQLQTPDGPVRSMADIVVRLQRAERFRRALGRIYEYVSELEEKLGEGELHEYVTPHRPRDESLLASEVIDEVKAIIGRAYLEGTR